MTALPPPEPLPPAGEDALAPPPAASSSPQQPPPSPANGGAHWGLWLAWAVAALALAVAVLLWQKVSAMQEQLARQSADANSRSVEARTLARQADAEARAAAGKLAALDGRLSDLAAYRSQMEALVQTVARTRDENLAVELEAAVRLAQDQAQLTGSAQPLMAALRTAERRLTRTNDPRLTPVLRAVARDLERLKNTSVADTAGLLARIDQLLRQVDDLPMANSVRAVPRARSRDATAPEDSTWWRRWLSDVADEARALLRVSRIERADAMLLSPEQAFFVRENLKLRLQGARLAVLARQYESARADLAGAATALGTWFDPSARRTQAAATLLQQIQGVTRGADVPRVDDTLVALGNATAAVER